MADGSANITLPWGDGELTFRLGMKQLRELQDKTGAGPEALYNRVRDGTWKVDDLRETIRLGLLGGGMDPPKAIKLVIRYFDEGGGYMQHKPIVAAILLAALMGPADDPLGKAGRGGSKTKTPTAKSPSPPKSGTPPQSE